MRPLRAWLFVIAALLFSLCGFGQSVEQRCQALYQEGQAAERTVDLERAVECYRTLVTLADSAQCYEPCFYDGALRVMLWDKDNNRDEEAIDVGLAATTTPASSQEQYPNQHLLYVTLAAIMNRNFYFAGVPALARKGMHYVRQQLSPMQAHYYQLPLCEAVAWLMIGQTAKADSICSYIAAQPAAQQPELQATLATLQADIQESRYNGVVDRKQASFQNLESLTPKMALVDARTSEGGALLREYISLMCSTLSQAYFDVDNVADERLWNRALANLLIIFSINGCQLQGREEEACDIDIMRKDFLSYHAGFHRKRPATWRDVQSQLGNGEAVVAFCCVPCEALVVRNGATQPTSIPIDEALFGHIVKGLVDEPSVIDSLYSQSGALSALWQLVEPKLGGISTLYITGSNAFTQINYGAIPMAGGGTVGQRYAVHTLLSATDIAGAKARTLGYRNMVAFGDIDYGHATHAATEKPMPDEPWHLTRGLPPDTRGGFDRLPGSRAELDSIAGTCASRHMDCRTYTGAVATEEAFKKLSGNAPSIIHLSTHGFMLAPLFADSTRRERAAAASDYKTVLSQSGLLFAGANVAWRDLQHGACNDGILTSREITHLDLSRCRLAVLPACKSALGESRNLTGLPFGVAYALRLAGVKQVLCALWSVSDQATTQFMCYFYRHLLTGRDARVALQQAQHDMIAAGYTSPYYWAAFQLVE